MNVPVGSIEFPQRTLWDNLNCPPADTCACAEDENPIIPANAKIASVPEMPRIEFTPSLLGIDLCWRRRGLESHALNRYKQGPLDRTSKFGSHRAIHSAKESTFSLSQAGSGKSNPQNLCAS